MVHESFKSPIMIYNPSAGSGSSKIKFKKYFNKINAYFGELITVHETGAHEDMHWLIDSIHKKEEHDLIITFGGDGTISMIANALMEIPKHERIPVFPIPGGTGDSLLRDLDIIGIETALNHGKHVTEPRWFDILLVEGLENDFKTYCINILGAGFVSKIVEYASLYGKKWGSMSYFIAAMHGLREFVPYKTKILYDDQVFESDQVYMLTISNTQYTGGAIKIAPDALFDDGIMDVVALHDIGRMKFLHGYMRAVKGTHLSLSGCTSFRAKKIEVYADPQFKLMPDGELAGTSPVRITVVPKQIPLFV